MNSKSNLHRRVIGLDAHPDTFTAAVLLGATPASAVIEKTFNAVPVGRVQSWASKNVHAQDVVVLEASGNSFQIARTLRAMGITTLVLESCHLGKLKEAHANNDKISAVRIGKAYLAGTAKEVWVPDLKTQERRDWFHAHGKAVKRVTQTQNRLRCYLSDNGVRLSPTMPLDQAVIQAALPWTPRQQQVIEGLLMELRHAQERRDHWRSLMAQEVLNDPQLLQLVRLCGVREVVAFALGAIIGDISRFESPKKLVKYVGLNPAFDHSGQNNWQGGIGGHGRSDLRALLIEAAHSILRSGDPLAKWARKLLARKSEIKLVVAAVARKLTVAVWYLMKGQWTALQDIEQRLSGKLGKIISKIGKQRLAQLNTTSAELRKDVYRALTTARIYVLDPNKIMPLRPTLTAYATPTTH